MNQKQEAKMSDTSIKFENISKQYRLGKIGTGTLSHDLKRWWVMNIRGKDDPYLKIGQINERSSKAEGEYVWALKDINFEVKQGEVLGIIGKNGAGKSTLLKILSRVTSPTTGRITAHGRIASLLEVGTGFHPEMTGRENIYMNGAIMGMSKSEITRKFDEIVDFSGIEKYIDTPVKRYSSGMTVRLGFAIAAHLEPEILVVDEVLAVGDAEFQKKAIGKMQDVSKGEGRTVLFVSHNMAAVKSLCNGGIVLSEGKISFVGNAQNSIEYYLNRSKERTIQNLSDRIDRKGNGKFRIIEILKFNRHNMLAETFLSGEKVLIEIKIANFENTNIDNLRLDFGLDDSNGMRISWFSTSLFEEKFIIETNSKFSLKMEIPEIPLTSGIYTLTANLLVNGRAEDWIPDAVKIEIENGDYFKSGKIIEQRQGNILIHHRFIQ